MNKNQRFRMKRRGSAVVEAAVIAPLMVLAMFGMVEVGQVYHIKQTVALASREGARAGALPGGDYNDVQNAVAAAMAGPNLTGYTLTTNVATLSATDTQVSVTVSMPFDRASFTGSLLGGGSFNIESTTIMRREGVDDNSSSGSGVTPS
jgi:Flp pilus assembly protein TadG